MQGEVRKRKGQTGRCWAVSQGQEGPTAQVPKGRHTSDGKTLLPGFIGCLGVPLEPELGLGVDLIAVRLHSGEGFDRDVLQEEGGRVSGPGARLSRGRRTVGLPWGQAQRRDQKGSVHVFSALSVLLHSMLTQFRRSIPC